MSLLYPFMYKATWKIYIGAILLPFVGFIFGYFVASVCRMEPFRRRTVALETGIQNFPLCMTLLSLSFSREVFAEISLFPLLYGVTCIVASVIFAVIYRIVAAFKAKTKKQMEYNQTDEENRKSLKETSKFMADINFDDDD